MSVVIYIGDEVSAAGYRLAGARVDSPEQARYLEAIDRARKDAELVLLSADIATRIPQDVLDDYLTAEQPAMVVVPDLRGRTAMPDLATNLRRQLGVLE